jgi:hypothetical protein
MPVKRYGIPTTTAAALPSFKRTVYFYSSNHSMQSANTWNDIDATNLPALSLALAVGDVVELEINAPWSVAVGNVLQFDWLIDQPTSADTDLRTIYGSKQAFLIEGPSGSEDLCNKAVRALFTATEAGVHSFKPQWRANSTSHKIANLDPNYSTPVYHTVTNKGPVAA